MKMYVPLMSRTQVPDKTIHISSCTIWVFIILQLAPCSLFSQQRDLYILNRSGNNILSIPLDSLSNPLSEKFNRDIVAAYDLVVDSTNAKLYWANGVPHRLLSGNPGDTTIIVVDTSSSLPVDLDIDFTNQKMYYADNGLGKICRSNLDGSNQEILNLDTLGDLTSIAIYPSQDLMFFADLDSFKIWSCAMDGRSNRMLLMEDSASSPIRLAIDTINQKLYWSDDARNRIERMDFDGTGREVFYQGGADELPFGLFIDQVNRKLYWTDYGTNQVLRTRMDSLDVETLVTTGLDDPVAVIVVVPGIYHRPIVTNTDIPLNAPSVLVYPNPANHMLSFSSAESPYVMEQITIFDNTGKTVYTFTTNQNKVEIDIGKLSSGYYIYKVAIGGQILTGHLSIIH